MAAPPDSRSSKQDRRRDRQRAGRRRRQRRLLVRVALPAAAALALLAAWEIDRSGPEKVVDAEVVRTQVWRHQGGDGRFHTHQRATLEIEGLVQTDLDRADDLQRGQRVSVRIRRGRLTGRPYFLGRTDAPPPGEDIPREEPAPPAEAGGDGAPPPLEGGG